MELKITNNAQQWLKQELNLQAGDGVKFFTQTGGVNGPVNYGPEQAFSKDNDSKSPSVSIIIDGINYHINKTDSWFFSGKTTTIDYNETDGLIFQFIDSHGEILDATTGASKGDMRFENYWY